VKKCIQINRPSKGSRARTVKVTDKTIRMLNAMDKYSPFLFNPRATLRDSFHISRKRLAQRLNNPRLLQIHFHTLRHWKATNEYAKNNSIKEVQQILGHKNLANTDRYTHLLNLETDEWIVRRPRTTKDEDDLIAVGFQFVRFDDTEGAPIYRKRK